MASKTTSNPKLCEIIYRPSTSLYARIIANIVIIGQNSLYLGMDDKEIVNSFQALDEKIKNLEIRVKTLEDEIKRLSSGS